jgi:hypothetical protein
MEEILHELEFEGKVQNDIVWLGFVGLDCHVASLLAMTNARSPDIVPFGYCVFPFGSLHYLRCSRRE